MNTNYSLDDYLRNMTTTEQEEYYEDYEADFELMRQECLDEQIPP